MNRTTMYSGAAILACMAAASAFTLLSVPADAMIPVHFGLDGTPDRYAGPLLAVSIMPVVSLLVTGLFHLLPRLDGNSGNLVRSGKAYGTVWVSVLAVLGVAHGIVLAHAFGLSPDVPAYVTAALGAFLILSGNMAGKIRSNSAFGVRTPWTLASDSVWNRTHRLFGWLSVITGLLLVMAAFVLPSPTVLASAVLTGLAALAIISTAYSYVIWKREEGQA